MFSREKNKMFPLLGSVWLTTFLSFLVVEHKQLRWAIYALLSVFPTVFCKWQDPRKNSTGTPNSIG